MILAQPPQSQPLTPVEAMLLAESHKAAGRLAEAEALLRRILAETPNYHPAYHTLGLIAYEVGKLPLAVELITQAVSLNNRVALYHRNLGEMCRRLGRLDEAVTAGKRATQLSPDDLDAHYNFGLALTDRREWTPAISAYRRALELNPQHGLSWNNLGAALEQQGDLTQAETAYAKAVALNSKHTEAQNNLGAIYSEQGRLEEACRCFEAAIRATPDFTEAHYNLSSLKTYRADDPHLRHLENNLGKVVDMPVKARIRYWFALGKAREDVGRFDESFSAYAEGNRLQHALLPSDEVRADELLAQIITVFDRDFFAARQNLPSPGEEEGNKAPIFIVGMPRSGTTLLEQILASHPAVHGAGELMFLHDVITAELENNAGGALHNQSAKLAENASKPLVNTRLPGMSDGSVGVAGNAGILPAALATPATSAGNFSQRFPGLVSTLTAEDFARLGAAYRERVWQLAPEAARITDKMPANFFYIGMIRLLLPNAKIIHAMRDPMDSCFSCYARLFNDTMEFAYDLGTLGRYYVRYIQLMQHWRSVLPADAILDLRYEDLVADTEGQARRILNFLDLPWDDNCLAFHQNKRHVKTASVAQVRKPIYKTSVARWQRFREHLTPLLEIVRDYRPADESVIERCLDLQNKGDYAAALALLEPHIAESHATLATVPPQLWHLHGISLYRLNRFDEARQSYQQALVQQPDFPGVFNSLGFVLQDMNRLEEARDCFAQALQLSPGFDMARLNLGMAQLKLGEWQAGWENYEARWAGAAESGNKTYSRTPCPLPQWSGQTGTEQQALLIIVEQGFGDTFQFSRYFDLATQHFAKVGFVCSAPTLRLMEWTFDKRVVLFNQMPTDYTSWHWQCPLMSLPRAFQTRPDNIPAAVPYLQVPQAAQAHWRARLDAAAPGRLRIGIAWAGRKVHQYDARRSLQFEQILPLLKDQRVTWVNLQKWGAEEAHPVIPADIAWQDWTEELTDFADTAALLVNLDLIISIDSAMVHLAGALARPVWMMNRFDSEWRWLGQRADSPWYPTLRIFNQPEFGDWQSVIEAVRAELSKLEKH